MLTQSENYMVSKTIQYNFYNVCIKILGSLAFVAFIRLILNVRLGYRVKGL